MVEKSPTLYLMATKYGNIVHKYQKCHSGGEEMEKAIDSHKNEHSCGFLRKNKPEVF